MTRTLSPALIAHLATRRTTLARCLRLDLVDGTSIGITDHDQDLSVNLGDGVLVYSAATGVVPSAIALSVGFDVDNLEAWGPIGATVTRTAVLGGRFDRARVRLFDVNWASPADIARLLKGHVAEARVEGGRFVLGIRGITDLFNQTIGRILSPYCTHDLGDAKCQATPAAYDAEVLTVSDEMAFTVSWTGSPVPADVAELVAGKVQFTSGALAGTRPVEIFSLSGTTVTLFAPLAEPPAIGDALTVTEGCDKLRSTCRDRFANVVNFGGFPEVPGSDQYLKYPVPGQ